MKGYKGEIACAEDREAAGLKDGANISESRK